VENEYNSSMNQLVEKLINFSLSSNYYEDMRKFILAFTSKYELNINTATLAVVIVILGSLYLSTYVSNRRLKRKLKPKTEHYDRTRSWIVRDIHSGKPILDRLKEDFNKARVNPAILKHTRKALKAIFKEEYLDLIKLQVTYFTSSFILRFIVNNILSTLRNCL